MACRDGERHLEEALASVSAQTFRDWEAIVVDDGSRDRTGAILAAAATRDPRIRVLRTGGEGLAAALNRAGSEARGEFFARHDADDRSHQERFARQVAWLDAYAGTGVVGTAAARIGPAGESRMTIPVPIEPDAIRRALRRVPPFVHGSVMIRADVFRAAGGYRAAFAASQDLDLWMRLPATIGLANLPDRLYEWRQHEGGTFASARDRQLRFAALARAFAAERRERGTDSYREFEAAENFEAFVARYRHRDRLCLLLGDVFAREGRVSEARGWLARALASPRTLLPALAWWAASFAIALSPRATRHAQPEGRATSEIVSR
jgi:glycosyltransferase involved in cell wall biosynthesis